MRDTAMNQKIEEYVKEHGFYFASNQEQMKLAQDEIYNGNLMTLNAVLMRVTGNRTIKAEAFYVPLFWAAFTSKGQLPHWVWLMLGWTDERKKGSYCNLTVLANNNPVEILVRIIDVRAGGKYEVVPVGGDTCIWTTAENLSD